MAEENERTTSAGRTCQLRRGSATDETDVSTRPGWREIFRQAFDKARREQQPTSRRELGTRPESFSVSSCRSSDCRLLVVSRRVFLFNTTKKATMQGRRERPIWDARVTPGQQRDWSNGIGDAATECRGRATEGPERTKTSRRKR